MLDLIQVWFLLTKLAIILLPRETSVFENIPGKRKSDKVPK